MLQCLDPEVELFGYAEQHQNFVGAVAVGMHQALAFQHLHQRLQLQIAARGKRRFALRHLGSIGFPLALIPLGFGESLANHILHTHASGGVAEGHSSIRCGDVAPALRVLTERELDSRLGAFEDHLAGALAPAHLDYRALSADGICAAVEDIRSGYAAGHGPVDGDVFRVQDVFDGDHGGHRNAGLIDAVRGRVRMAIDDAGHQILPGGVDDLRIGGNQDLLPHFHDFSIAHQHRALEGSFGDGEDGGVLNDNGARRQRWDRQRNCQQNSRR